MKNIKLPLDRKDIAKLKAGDQVLLSGVIYTARDQAHKRLCECIERGKKLFLKNCAVCHGNTGQGDGPASKALNPKPSDLVKGAGHHSDGDIAWKIANGRGPMPGWEKTLSENDIWDLVNFVQSLKPLGPQTKLRRIQ